MSIIYLFLALETFFFAWPSSICLALDPNWRVLSVSEKLLSAGLQATNNAAYKIKKNNWRIKWYGYSTVPVIGLYEVKFGKLSEALNKNF